jgi:hypothetical protein
VLPLADRPDARMGINKPTIFISLMITNPSPDSENANLSDEPIAFSGGRKSEGAPPSKSGKNNPNGPSNCATNGVRDAGR